MLFLFVFLQGEFDAKDGVTLGHEIVGTVADISPKYAHLVKGDRVAVNPNMLVNKSTMVLDT